MITVVGATLELVTRGSVFAGGASGHAGLAGLGVQVVSSGAGCAGSRITAGDALSRAALGAGLACVEVVACLAG